MSPCRIFRRDIGESRQDITCRGTCSHAGNNKYYLYMFTYSEVLTYVVSNGTFSTKCASRICNNGQFIRAVFYVSQALLDKLNMWVAGVDINVRST